VWTTSPDTDGLVNVNVKKVLKKQTLMYIKSVKNGREEGEEVKD